MQTYAPSIVLDGAHGEGGGALIRAALVMSVLTQQGVTIENVRGGTKYPGLDVEDLTILKALTKMSDAKTARVERGSHSFEFIPQRPPRKLEGVVVSDRNETGRGSNAMIVLCTLLPVLARTGTYCEVAAEGETYGRGALSFDYFSQVSLPILRRMNLNASVQLEKSSFSRDQAGVVKIAVEPGNFEGLHWTDRGRPDILRATVVTCRLDSAIAGRAISHLQRLAQSAKLQIDVERIEAEGNDPGIYITVWAPYAKGLGGGGSIGTRGVRVETIAQQAFEQCFEWMTSDATLDPYNAEHILLPACLATSSSDFKISELTPRLLTTVWVIKQFTPVRIVVRGTEGTPGRISINLD